MDDLRYSMVAIGVGAAALFALYEIQKAQTPTIPVPTPPAEDLPANNPLSRQVVNVAANIEEYGLGLPGLAAGAVADWLNSNQPAPDYYSGGGSCTDANGTTYQGDTDQTFAYCNSTPSGAPLSSPPFDKNFVPPETPEQLQAAFIAGQYQQQQQLLLDVWTTNKYAINQYKASKVVEPQHPDTLTDMGINDTPTVPTYVSPLPQPPTTKSSGYAPIAPILFTNGTSSKLVMPMVGTVPKGYYTLTPGTYKFQYTQKWSLGVSGGPKDIYIQANQPLTTDDNFLVDISAPK